MSCSPVASWTPTSCPASRSAHQARWLRPLNAVTSSRIRTLPLPGRCPDNERATIHRISTGMSDMLSDTVWSGCRGGGLSLVAYPRPPGRWGFSTCVSLGEPSAMQLSGLIPAALRDRGLARARDLARKGFVDSDALDLTAPASLRPFVVAAVAGRRRDGRRRPPGARGHRHQPRGRRPGRRARLPARPGPGRGLPVLGDAAARAALAALRHGRPPPGRAAPPRPPRRARRCRSSSRPCAACCSRSSRASATSSRWS